VKKMICPSCKKELPAPLDGVASVECPCGVQYSAQRIIEYNEMIKKPDVIQ